MGEEREQGGTGYGRGMRVQIICGEIGGRVGGIMKKTRDVVGKVFGAEENRKV